MKIYVKSRKYMEKLWNINPQFFLYEKRAFISIFHIEKYPPFKYNGDRLLCLKFDDLTEQQQLEEQDILFNHQHSNKIIQFIKFIQNNNIEEIYVNCSAGISRSGAIGQVLNDYFNMNNKEQRNLFFQNNPQIVPNCFVKRILYNDLFKLY